MGKRKAKRDHRPLIEVIHTTYRDDTVIGRAHTLEGVARHVGYDMTQGGLPPYKHRGLGWKIIARGTQRDLERIGAVLSHGQWMLFDAQHRVIAECEVAP